MRKILKQIRVLLINLFLILITFISLIPFILILLTSIKNKATALSMPPQWIFTPTLDNYAALFEKGDLIKSIVNSLIIAGGTTLISTIIGTLTAYAFTRFQFKGSTLLSRLILFLRLVPPITFVIPYFLMWRALGIPDTHLSMILMYLPLSLPLATWMIHSFFKELPQEMEEAALVDGCGRWQSLRLILIPSMLPGILAAATLSFIQLWNEFLYAMVNTGKNTRTLPVEIYNAIGYYQLDWARLSSTAVIAIIPAILFIALTQKYIVRGLTMGAVKG